MDKKRFMTSVREWDADAVTHALRAAPELAALVLPNGKTTLMCCADADVAKARRAAAESVAVAAALIDAGADVQAMRIIVDEGEEFRATALWYAVAWGRNLELARFLLERGADPHDCLWAVTWSEDATMAALLLEFGAQLERRFQGRTPLLDAVHSKKFKLVPWLVENGADINAADDAGETVLHYAVAQRFTAAQTELLLRLGADPTKTTAARVTPLELARELGRSKTLALFEAPAKLLAD